MSGACLVLLAWWVTKSPQFEIYSDSGPQQAKQALVWFEELRGFFQQNGLLGKAFDEHNAVPLRVVGFGSQKEYNEYRLRPVADAFYAFDGRRDYVVMSGLEPGSFNVAAHEYAHHILHEGRLRLPEAMNEGLAEYFSTLRLQGGGYEVGGDIPARTQVLKRNAWIPLADLLNDEKVPALLTDRKPAAVFYAESWALVDMLMSAPKYAGQVEKLTVPLDVVTRDLHDWVGKARASRMPLKRR